MNLDQRDDERHEFNFTTPQTPYILTFSSVLSSKHKSLAYTRVSWTYTHAELVEKALFPSVAILHKLTGLLKETHFIQQLLFPPLSLSPEDPDPSTVYTSVARRPDV